MAKFGSECEETTRKTSISNQIRGSSFKCPTPGVVQNIKAWLHAYFYEVPTEPIKIRAAIYRKSTNKLVAVSEQKTFDYKFDWQWVTFVFSSPPTLKAEEYWLVLLANLTLVGSNQNNVVVGYLLGGEGCTDSATYPNFPNDLTPSIDATTRCIYCTYKPTEKTLPGKGRLYVYAVADSEEVDSSFLINREGPYYTGITGKTLDLDPNDYTLIGNYKGQTDKKTVTIEEGDVKSVTLTFTEMHKLIIVSNPPELPVDFTFNTEKQSTPFTRELVSGTYTIVMPASVMVGLDEYVFEQWENGSRKPTRTVTLASPQEVTVTATYRLRQIDEAGPINQRQMKDTLQEVVGQGADLSPTNPMPTEDTGKHSNPKQYEKDNGFYSTPTTIGAAATALYTTTTTPARTSGKKVTVYTFDIENRSGAQAWVWLEVAGNPVTVAFPVANNNTLSKDWPSGLNLGDVDINVNGTAGCVVQITGTEA